MKKNSVKPLPLALYGMDERTYRTMSLYLAGPCKGIAIVVSELEAEASIIDADHIKAKELLDERKAKSPGRPIILLSLEELFIEGTVYVKKPVITVDLVVALKQVIAQINADPDRSNNEKPVPEQILKPEIEPVPEKAKKMEAPVAEKKQAGVKHVDGEERKKTSKHRTAMDLTETGFSAYIGLVDGVDFSDPQQVLKASYNPKEFFLGYVQSALKTCKAKGRVLQLNSGWKPLVIFPHSQEIWLDADDKQLKAFAGLEMKSSPSRGVSLSSINRKTMDFSQRMDGFYDIDHFLWKLAVWTSKGRYPEMIDIGRPVYLMQWPNFTRLLVTPHAMRIAALLVRGPRTAMSIANALKIKPQYVFIFISAANVLGLAGQAKRQVDTLLAPPEVKASKSKGLLSRILGRLRG